MDEKMTALLQQKEQEKAQQMYEELMKEYPEEQRIIQHTFEETPTVRAMQDLMIAFSTIY